MALAMSCDSGQSAPLLGVMCASCDGDSYGSRHTIEFIGSVDNTTFFHRIVQVALNLVQCAEFVVRIFACAAHRNHDVGLHG